MSNDATKVAAGKPKVGGALYWAPADTTPPTDASTALGSAFKCLGYVSEDRTREEIKAWGGDTVLVLEEETSDTFRYTLIECTNAEVLKHVYGQANVTVTAGDSATTPPTKDKIAITVTQIPEADEGVMVVEQLLKQGIKRIVIPRAAVTAVEEIEYVDNDVIGYDTTVAALPVVIDGQRVYHKEYIEL